MAANIKFVLHGDSLDAYLHSGSGKVGYNYTPLGSVNPTVQSDAGAIGGSRLNFDTGQTDIKARVWPGYKNASLTGKFTILARVKFSFTGAPANLSTIFSVGGPGLTSANNTGLAQVILHPDGTIRLYLNNARGAAIFSNSSFGTWSPSSTSVYYDIVLRWDGTTGANKVVLYIDGTSFGTKTAGAVAADANGNFFQGAISLGMGMGVSGLRGDAYINEFVIWDDEIDPTSAGLNLSGNARSSFVSTAGLTLDPTNSTDPGVSNVGSSTTYIINGVTLTGTLLSSTPPSAANVRLGTNYINAGVTTTGTLIVPATSDVKHDVVFDLSSTGTYRGLDLWSTVAASDVRSGTGYTANGVSLTGSLAVPAVYSGTSSQINYAQIKENIRYILDRDNTTTANFDLSTGMDRRVQKVMTINPGMIPVQASNYPYVTVFVDAKDVKATSIGVNQKNVKREATVKLKFVGGVWNSKTPDKVKDKAADECELLMENIEEVIRRDPTFSSTVTWHMPSSVTYHNRPLAGEEAHLRIGILTLDCKLFY